RINRNEARSLNFMDSLGFVLSVLRDENLAKSLLIGNYPLTVCTPCDTVAAGKTAMNRKPKMQRYPLRAFQAQFPDDAACLEWLKNYLYPEGIFCKNCERVTKHHRVVSRPS